MVQAADGTESNGDGGDDELARLCELLVVDPDDLLSEDRRDGLRALARLSARSTRA